MGNAHKMYMNWMLAIISGVLTGIAFPAVFGGLRLPNLGFLAWFSLVPLFFAMKGSPPRRAFMLSAVAAFVYYGLSLWWIYTAMNTYGHLNPFISLGVLILMLVVVATHISLAPFFSSWIENKCGIKSFWTLPLFWVVFEFSRNYTPCNGFPWGNITNTQYAYLPVIQIVDVVGIYGLVYLMILVNAWIADQIKYRHKFLAGKTVMVAVLLVTTIVYGYIRIGEIDKRQSTWPGIRAAMLQGNIPQDEKIQTGNEVGQLAPYTKFTQAVAESNVDLILWPESGYPWLVPTSADKIPAEHLGIGGLPLKKDPYIIFGGLSVEGNVLSADRKIYNSMVMVDKNGDILGRYHKFHLAPFGEYVPYKELLFFAKKLVAPVGNFEAGKNLTPLFTDNYQIGGIICYEDIFPEISRALVKNGANFIAVITNDAWFGRSSAPFQHLAISVFRAVENRRWLIRAANSGVSAVVDATGRIISRTDIFEAGMIVSNIRLASGTSLYTRFGDWFAWLCIAIAVFFTGRGIYDAKRNKDKMF